MLTISESLDIIRPCLGDIINAYKTQGEWRIHSSNTIIKNRTQSEWRIQLMMATKFLLFLLKKILMRLVPCVQKVIM